MSSSQANQPIDPDPIEQRISAMLASMTLAEKIGQMSQLNASEGFAPDYLGADLRAGRIGSVLNVVDVAVVNELQRIAVEESRLGIPLLVGRDVIHGFKTVMPIPLGQAATWNPAIVREGARVAALEAATTGINWTFAPMIDISRDARWGRIAESLGEDPFLASALGVAMVKGFQGDDLAPSGSIAACAKHFAGYGAVEERPRLRDDQHSRERIAQCLPAAVQSRGRRRCRDADDVVQRSRRCSGDRQRIPAAAGAAGRVAI